MRDRIVGMKTLPVMKLRGFSGGNPKTPTPSDIDQLGDSLANHGYVQPVIVRDCGDGSYELIDGHSRVHVIMTSDPTAKIKCIIVDVESVAEGRRVLLALQKTVGFDLKKLESFVRDALNEGATASDIIADTGFTGADLDALASAADQLVRGASEAGGKRSRRELEDDGETNERVSRAGLIPEHVQFGCPLTRPQNEIVHDAVKLAKQVANVKISGDALTAICLHYVNTHRDANAAPPKKKRGGRRGAQG